MDIIIHAGFFFNDTATTWIYTYGHTRSLHAALPIFAYVGSWVAAGLGRCFQLMETDDLTLLQSWAAEWSDLTAFEIVPVTEGKVTAAARSEEHTSELQSLMRISYAVFCLKKKQHTCTPHTPYKNYRTIDN